MLVEYRVDASFAVKLNQIVMWWILILFRKFSSLLNLFKIHFVTEVHIN